MGLLDWLGFQQRDDVPGPSDPSTAFNIPSRARAGRVVGVGEANSLSIVYRAVQLYETSIKQLSLHVEKDGRELDVQPAIIRQPNLGMSRAAFIAQTQIAMVTTGNAYWLIERDSSGRVVNLANLNPLSVVIKEESVGGRITGFQDGNTTYRPEQIKHIPLLRVPGTNKGLGPIQAAQAELRGALDTRDYASSWFVNSGIPAGGYLKSDQTLSPEVAKNIRDGWTEAVNNRTGTPVMGNGFEFKSVYLSPRDAQWIEAQQFNVTQIARLFGVPASLMLATVEGNSQSYSNVEQDWLAFTRFSLMAYLVEIEEAFSDLLPRGQRVRFNIEALLRADTTTRYAAHAVAIQAGFLTVDEVREIEGYPALPKSEVAVPSLASLPPASEPTEEEATDE